MPPDLSTVPADLEGLCRESEPLRKGSHRLTFVNGWIRYVESTYERFFIDLRGDFETYLGHFSGKTRSTLRRKVRKFARLSGGDLDWREYKTPQEMNEFHTLASKISNISYQERLFGAGIPSDQNFSAIMRNLAAQDRVRAYILFHENRPISYLYCQEVDRRLVYRYVGFVPGYAKYSPGTVLQFLALQHLFSEGMHELFDFTEGEGDHKRLFATHSVRCANVFYLRRTPRTLALVLTHWCVTQISNALATVLDWIGVKRGFRQILYGQRTIIRGRDSP